MDEILDGNLEVRVRRPDPKRLGYEPIDRTHWRSSSFVIRRPDRPSSRAPRELERPRCHSLTDCVTLAFAPTTFCLVEFKFAVVDFALPAPFVWVVYAHVSFRKFYPALGISARFLKRHSAPGFASPTVSSMSYRSDHQRKRSAQNGSRECPFQHDDFPMPFVRVAHLGSFGGLALKHCLYRFLS
jgi:hypothetical protein